MGINLTTPRMVLRQFTMDDLELLVALDSDPEVLRYLSPTPTPRHALEQEVLPRWIAEYAQAPGFGCWAALDRRSKGFLGWFSLRRNGDSTQAELGYRLRRAAWGQGLATEGGRALIDRACGQLGINRVYAQTMSVNRGSRRVMEKLGMRHVRTFHEHFDDPLPGIELGEVEYAITRDEWLARGGVEQRPG